MMTSNNQQGLKSDNIEKKLGHVNPGISENSKHVDEAKASSRKLKWSTEEDDILKRFVEDTGIEKGNGKVDVNWVEIAHILDRTYKSCRLRWYNQLAPGINFDRFSPEEDDLIIRMVHEIGPMWSKIAEKLKCRTDNQVKNRWNSALKKVQGQNLPPKVSSRRLTQTSRQGAKSTRGYMNGSRSSPSSNSTPLLISGSTSTDPVAQVPPFGSSLHVSPPYCPDGSLHCDMSPAFDTPYPSERCATPDPALTFDWLYSPSLHPPGSEIPDVYPAPSPFCPTQENQCESVGRITAMEQEAINWVPEPEKPASDLPGFDWLNL